MRAANIFYSIASGPKARRRRLMPVGLLIGIAWVVSPVVAALLTDRALGLQPLLAGLAGSVVGLPLVAAGLALWGWCVALFLRADGTPVPFDPPPRVVARGPYAHVRNPMLGGIFIFLAGLGFALHSLSLAVAWTPLFIAVNLLLVKTVEEPELERRLGAAYEEYRRRVPMLIPKRRS
jgi:protein-S-isoprenylcysteine O-methyltransferase Ste14